MDRRAEGDKHARKKQCARAAAKNVSTKFVFRFHSYTSVLRREPRVAIDPAGRGSGGAPGETPNELDAKPMLPPPAIRCQYKICERKLSGFRPHSARRISAS